MLEADPGIWVTGEAGTAPAALVTMPALRPDAAVLGAQLPDGDAVSQASSKGPKYL